MSDNRHHHHQQSSEPDGRHDERSKGGRDRHKVSTFRLAFSATFHCLLGCGLGEVAGMIIGAALNLDNVTTIVISVILGFIGGFALGIIPLFRAGIVFGRAFRIVQIGEGLSIAVMETFEVLVQVHTPGVMGRISLILYSGAVCCWPWLLTSSLLSR